MSKIVYVVITNKFKYFGDSEAQKFEFKNQRNAIKKAHEFINDDNYYNTCVAKMLKNRQLFRPRQTPRYKLIKYIKVVD